MARLARVSWKSAGGSVVDGAVGVGWVAVCGCGGWEGGGVRMEEGLGGVGATRSSRHSLWRGGGSCGAGCGVVVVVRVGAEVLGLEGTSTDWKAWMGRASRNSWAIMKGIFFCGVSLPFFLVV